MALKQFRVVWNGDEHVLFARDEEDARIAIAGRDAANAKAYPSNLSESQVRRLIARSGK